MKPGFLFPAMLSVALLVGCGRAGAQNAPETPKPSPAEDQSRGAAIDPKAMTLMTAMAKNLAEAKAFSVTINGSFDIVQENEQKITFGERRSVLLSRPNSLKTEVLDSDGGHRLVVFDGKSISILNLNHSVYGQVEREGSVDDVVRYVIQDLGIRLPLALMLVTTLPAELQSRIRALAYVERDSLTTTPTDHLAGRTDTVDFEIWVAQGDNPVPQRLAITYRDFEGSPQYRAEFSNWNMAPDISSEKLAFQAPKGAEQIPVLVRLPAPKTDSAPHAKDAATQQDKATGVHPK